MSSKKNAKRAAALTRTARVAEPALIRTSRGIQVNRKVEAFEELCTLDEYLEMMNAPLNGNAFLAEAEELTLNISEKILGTLEMRLAYLNKLKDGGEPWPNICIMDPLCPKEKKDLIELSRSIANEMEKYQEMREMLIKNREKLVTDEQKAQYKRVVVDFNAFQEEKAALTRSILAQIKAIDAESCY